MPFSSLYLLSYHIFHIVFFHVMKFNLIISIFLNLYSRENDFNV